MSSPSKLTGAAADRWVILAAMVIPSIVTWIYFVSLAGQVSSGQQLAFALGKAVQFALPIVWVAWAQHERVRPHGLQTRGWTLGIAFGLAVVAMMAALYFGVLKPQGLFAGGAERIKAKVIGFGITSSLGYTGLAIFYALIHSGLEEYYWRWFVFRQLGRLLPLTWAAVISSLAFMAHHVVLLATFFGWSSPLTYLFSVSVAVGGLFWAWLYHRTQSIYAPWISHLIVDGGIFWVGYDIVRVLFHGG